MFGAKSASSPCSSGSKMSKFDGKLLADPFEYRQVVGALQYLTLTCLDISFVVNQLYQQMHSPSSTHWSVAKRVLKHLKIPLTMAFYILRDNYISNLSVTLTRLATPMTITPLLAMVFFWAIA